MDLHHPEQLRLGDDKLRPLGAKDESWSGKTAAPIFTSGLRASPYRAIVRARWVAEQHFEYETSNNSDVILLSMRSRDPLTTAVMLPDELGRLSLRQCRTRDEQRAFYDRNRSKRLIAAADVSTAIASDWYGFVGGALTHKNVRTGAITLSRFVGILPVSHDEDTISGELGFGLSEAQVTAMTPQSTARRRAFTQVQQEWLAAINSGDFARLADLYAEDAYLAEREYPGTAQAANHGRNAIVAFYKGLFERLGKPVVDILTRSAEDWYSFAELVWECNAEEGKVSRVRTANITSLSKDGKIAFQLGYGTDPQSINEG